MAGQRHFACTGCGKCCYGLLPLTLADAISHAHRFPLGIMWTPVRQNQRSFDLTARLGTTVRLRDRRNLALRITAVAYMPQALPCPALGADNLCTIHADKPARCRTMPFFPYLEEAEQAAQLTPRKGWDCDVSTDAPAVFHERTILDRADFDAERAELLRQAPLLKHYGAALMTTVPGLLDKLGMAALRPAGGDVLLGISTLLPHWTGADVADFARRQIPVLEDFAARTANDIALAEFHHRYRQWSREMTRLAG
ncbi:MAG TPA: YkgJ family cysteine cluster protein [Magnetospirillum sp.]|nr:YkgJ family cysteine cluster protein [Magnetospirillum sp.]